MIQMYKQSKKENIKVPSSMFKVILCQHRQLSDNLILYDFGCR